MSLARVSEAEESHLTACPFVRPDAAGDTGREAHAASAEGAR